MKNYKKIIFSSIITLLISSCATKTTPNLFTSNEHMVVNYSSEGCFHHTSNVLVFHENNVTIYTTMNQWNQKIARTKMGTLTLSQEDKERLNKLFTYYDGELQGGCTTRDTIEIKRYRKEQLVSTKKLVDASCGEYGNNNELGFRELVYRLKNKNKDEMK